ncbi:MULTISPECIES: outer membrane protein [Brucella/Ochrobactrum group]|jgi:opacity protein-like surface antigen|uniref:Porin family protein n=1 Tax=Brucella pseudintermedia TaxID=370111 RepID=A0ABY5U8W6_9HYPH|nr:MULTISPECIES: outer membrane protein [Brucella/Ochrobactrum group]KAB2680131.1 porin family protein [Brucella pseudintermedia]NKE77641.1 porin family protein [Ochrobactrum sp. MC-1LL]TWG95313.1 opacity protein-like surface antigen [Ochrobactrum sp. J50]UWL59296.1 porin family protein [Brucella pseudintermedia]WPM79715.1 porin family protein [Brucella pseudintermedia]
MYMQWRAFCSSAALLAGFCIASQSFAADLDMISYEPGAPAQQPVEVGSGWYLRGDIGYNISSKARLQAETPFGSASESFDLDKNVVPSIGIGYQFTDNLRGDVTFGYSKQGFDDLDVDVRSWDIMANAYVDLGNYSGFTPYLGAGLGFANVRYSINTAYGDYKMDDDYRLAWALMAGVGIDVASNVKLDVGYRYGVIEGADIASAAGITLSDKDIQSHQLRAGVRFTTW